MVFLAWPGAPDAMLVDDAWYYLRTAQNVVEGYGVSFDRAEPFNGFHPLWLLSLLPLAALNPGPDGLARAVLLIQLGVTLVGVWNWGRALKASREVYALAAVLLANPWAAKVLMCGQESALAFSLTGALAVVLREERSGWVAGLLTGLCVLARFDSALWVGVLLVAGLASRPRALLLAVLVGGAMLLPWVAWSQAHFETVIPVSAAIKAEMASGAALSRWAAGCCAGLMFLFAALWCLLHRRERLVVGILIGGALEVTRLVALSQTNGISIWYLWPLFPSVLLVGLSFLTRTVLRMAGLVLLLLAAGLSWAVRLAPASYAVATASREAGVWIREHTAGSAQVAGWDIGATAAWSDRRFRNLEGLAASWRFKREVLEKRQLRAFLASGEVEFVAQYFGRGPLEPQFKAAGLEPRDWQVLWSREVEMRSITSLGVPWRFVFVVLAFRPLRGEQLPNEEPRPRVLPEGESPKLDVAQE